jgi:hypothetical protein
MAKAAQAASAPKAAATPAPAAAPAAAKGKSIVDPKYRNKYKATDKDWLAKFLDEQATKTRDKKVTEGDGEKQVTKTVKVPDGVDVDALFTLAAKNHLDVKKFEAQRTSHGFGGRFRMTVRNMLQTVIKQRHGVFNTGGTFLTAPADWLSAKGAPDKPTHNRDGSKIAAPPKPTAAAPAAEAAPKA